MSGGGRPIAVGLLALAGGLFAGPASAAVCRGIDFPDRIEAQGTALVLNGLGVRKATFLRISVYVAALYVPHGAGMPTADARAIMTSPGPVELVLHFVRGVGVRDIRNAFEEGFAGEAGGRLPPALAARVSMLNGWMEDMRAGEAMTFLRLPTRRGVELEIDGRAKGIVPGDDFAEALWAIWLGGRPPNPELKAGLLGGPCR